MNGVDGERCVYGGRGRGAERAAGCGSHFCVDNGGGTLGIVSGEMQTTLTDVSQYRRHIQGTGTRTVKAH